MPIYEYRCRECGFQKEFLQRMSDAPLTDCLACGKPTLDKMVSAAGFQLKGTGWYATDFKNSGAKPAAKPEKSADSAKPAANADKSEAKPDKPAASPSKESSTTESSTSAGAASA